MEFVSKRKKLKVTIDGEQFEMNMPNFGENEDMNQKIAEAEAKDVPKICKDFFEMLGLPKEAQRKLDAADFEKLYTFVVTGGKKND